MVADVEPSSQIVAQDLVTANADADGVEGGVGTQKLNAIRLEVRTFVDDVDGAADSALTVQDRRRPL